MAFYILGVDVSYWQGEMNWLKTKSAGANFAFIRAGSINGFTHVCYEDYRWKENIEEAVDILPVGAYWYLRPTLDVKKQALYFFNLIKPYIGRKNFRWVICDIEETGPAVAAKTFLDEVKRLSEGKVSSKLVYTGPDIWKNRLTGDKSWAIDCDLHIANYEVERPEIPAPWTKYSLWQFSARGNGKGREFGASSGDIFFSKGPKIF